MIQPQLVLIVIIVCVLLLLICICVIPATNSQAAIRDSNIDDKRNSSSPSVTPFSGEIPELPTDRFGVQMLYPTKIGGEEWYMNMVNPTSDRRFNPQDHITKNSDGSWKMKSDKVRMYVYTSDGYNPAQVTSSNSGQSKVAARGFMNSPQDWKDVEITGYVKLNAFSENDNFVWFTRGGRHTDSDQCQGSGYKGNLFYLGETQFSKEQWHVSYAKSSTSTATDPLQGKWIGFKFVMYNFVTRDTKPAVKLENWIDPDADGRDWVKVYEGADAGKWGRAGIECQVRADQVLSWGGPIAAFRWDFAPDVDFKDFSVREITGENGTVDAIAYFTGTSTSSNVQELANSGSDKLVDPVNIPSDALRNNSPNSDLVNRSSENTPTPTAPTPAPGNDGIAGESFDEQEVSSGNMVYKLWVQGDEDNTDLYLKISQDSGATFGSTINLSNNPASLSYNPQIVASGENVYIVWEDDDGVSGNSDIFYMRSSDGGISFTERRNISNDPSGSGSPQLSVSGNNVYVAWTGTSPDSTDIFLAHSTNNGDSFSNPENLSNDPDISFNPVLSVNGTHVLVEWTDQDDKGLTKTKSLSLPQLRAESYDDNTYAGASYALNSTYTTSNELTDQDLQNSTLLQLNETQIETQTQTELKTDKDAETETQGALNQTALNQTALNQTAASGIPDSPPAYSSASNSSSYSNSNSGSNSITTSIPSPQTNQPKIGNLTTVSNSDTNDNNATAINDRMNSKIDGLIDNQVKQTAALPDQVNIGADELRAITTAQEALEARGKQKISEQVNLTEKYPPVFIPDGSTQALQTTQEKEQEKLDQIADSQLNLDAADQQTETKSSLSGESKQKSPSLKHAETGARDVREKQIEEKPEHQAQHQQQQQAQQQQEHKRESSQRSNHIDPAPSPEPLSATELIRQSPEQQHTELNEQSVTNDQIQRAEKEQKILLQKEIAAEAKEKRHKQQARERVQNLIREANEALNNAEQLIKQAKFANQNAQFALGQFNSQNVETDPNQEASKQVIPEEINHLINEAKVADQLAQIAVEKFNDLRRAADNAVEEFNTKYNIG